MTAPLMVLEAWAADTRTQVMRERAACPKHKGLLAPELCMDWTMVDGDIVVHCHDRPEHSGPCTWDEAAR